MKKIIGLLAILFVIVSANAQDNKKEYTFLSGDTNTTFPVANAKVVYFMINDSVISGTDSISITIQYTFSNGRVLTATFSVHLLATTTRTTDIASTLLIPGDNATGIWAFYPGAGVDGGALFTGTFKITRLNGVNASTPYLAKTRMVFFYE